MKKYAWIAVLMTTMGAVAQTPAAPPPMAKPGLTLTSTGFDDGGITAKKTPRLRRTALRFPPSSAGRMCRMAWLVSALILHDPDTALNKTTSEVRVSHGLQYSRDSGGTPGRRACASTAA